MAQLAGTEITRQAIFLIEAGKMRPSMRTLKMIAARTGKPVEFFIDGPSGRLAADEMANDPRVDQLQALCLQQQFGDAIELAVQLLNERLPRRVEAHVRHYAGQAFVRSSRPDEGLEQLRRAQVLLEAEPDPWLAVECADWEASALYLKEDERALAVAENALRLCRLTSPRLPGTEARILEHIGAIHVKNHDFDRAVACYEQALEAAGAVRDLARVSRTYHGLSIAYQERGEISRAIEFTHKALALYALENDNALLARGENELGLLLMKQGQVARAEATFRSALEHFDQSGTQPAKSHVLLSLAELFLRTGRLDEGVDTADTAINLARELGEVMAESTGHQLLGQLHERGGKPQLADKAVATAIRVLKEHHLRARLAEVHASYAEVLEARGESRRAARHWKDAALHALPARDLGGPRAGAR